MFTNQQTTDLADFIAKLDTFLDTTVGTWTTFDTNFAGGEWAARKTGAGFDIALAAQWDTTTPSDMGVYHWHGSAYSGALKPWSQIDDSGNGFAGTSNASLSGQRHAPITDNPIQFWCFEDDHYFHVVVEALPGVFTHFGAGQLIKFGDWTGGEYVYGYRAQGGITGNNAIDVGFSVLLDGLAQDGPPQPTDMELRVATVHIENLPGQVASGKFAVHMGNQASGNLGNDRQAAPKGREHFSGGFRGGFFARNLGRQDGSDLSGLLPMYPIVSYYWRRGTNDIYGPMGYMKDVRGCSIKNYVGGDEVVIGGDTWVLFPSRNKWISGSHDDTTEWQGIAYKKVVA